jgi:hypothetical protein
VQIFSPAEFSAQNSPSRSHDVAVSDAPAHPADLKHSNSSQLSQQHEAKQLSSSQTIIEDILQEDPLKPTYTPPEVEISPPPFSYSDMHNVDPRGLTYCFLTAEYKNGTIKKRILSIDCAHHSLTLYKLGGKKRLWSFHFSQLKGIEASEDGLEWDETLPTDSVVLIPNVGIKLVLFLCYPVDSVSLRLCLNAELIAFRNTKAHEYMPSRTVHGLRCLLHEGKVYSGSSTMSWNSRVLSVYCGRAYILGSFADMIPSDIVDLLGCRVESSAQVPCQLILHAAIRHTFTFSSPKVRDVFANALKQAKTMYETSVTQYSEYCRGMRLLAQQNLLYAVDAKRTLFREQFRLAKVDSAQDVPETTSGQKVQTVSNGFFHSDHAPNSTASHVEGSLAPGQALTPHTTHSNRLSTRLDDHEVPDIPRQVRVSGQVAYDQVSNMSTSSSATEHNLTLRLFRKYESLHAAEFGASQQPRALSVKAASENSRLDLLNPGLMQSMGLVSDLPSRDSQYRSNFAVILPHLVVAVTNVPLNLLAADILDAYGPHSKLYLFDAGDAAGVEAQLPVQHTASFIFDQDHPPSLASICMSVLPNFVFICRL